MHLTHALGHSPPGQLQQAFPKLDRARQYGTPQLHAFRPVVKGTFGLGQLPRQKMANARKIPVDSTVERVSCDVRALVERFHRLLVIPCIGRSGAHEPVPKRSRSNATAGFAIGQHALPHLMGVGHVAHPRTVVCDATQGLEMQVGVVREDGRQLVSALGRRYALRNVSEIRFGKGKPA